MNAVALDFPPVPLPHVHVSFHRLPHPRSMLLVTPPLSRIVLAVVPEKLADLGAFVAEEAALVESVFCFFQALVLVPLAPAALEYPVPGDHHAVALRLALPHLSEVEPRLLHELHCEVAAPHQLVHVDELVFDSVGLDEGRNGLLGGDVDGAFPGFLCADPLLHRGLSAPGVVGPQRQHIDLDKLFAFEHFVVRNGLPAGVLGEPARALHIVGNGLASAAFGFG